MFDITSLTKVKINAVHAVTRGTWFQADSTVFTVMGGFNAHKHNHQSWTKQCIGPVDYNPSRLGFSSPQVVKCGETLGVYVAASSQYCTGITACRQQPVSDGSITISSGVMLTSSAEFEGIHYGNFSFCGGIEYAPAKEDISDRMLNNLSRDLHSFYLSDDMADMTIIIGDSHFAAHGIILAARSPVFRVMLQHPMRESQTREVHIEGVEEATMTAMLRYIYSGSLDPNMSGKHDLCMSLARAAHQYDLPTLVEACIDVLAEHMHLLYVSDLLILADDLSCHPLKQQCLKFIGSHGAAVQDTEGFLRASHRHSLVLEVLAAISPKEASAA